MFGSFFRDRLCNKREKRLCRGLKERAEFVCCGLSVLLVFACLFAVVAVLLVFPLFVCCGLSVSLVFACLFAVVCFSLVFVCLSVAVCLFYLFSPVCCGLSVLLVFRPSCAFLIL